MSSSSLFQLAASLSYLLFLSHGVSTFDIVKTSPKQVRSDKIRKGQTKDMNKVQGQGIYTGVRPLSRDLMFCFLLEISVTNWAAQ